jgi:hypothetical protein
MMTDLGGCIFIDIVPITLVRFQLFPKFLYRHYMVQPCVFKSVLIPMLIDRWNELKAVLHLQFTARSLLILH